MRERQTETETDHARVARGHITHSRRKACSGWVLRALLLCRRGFYSNINGSLESLPNRHQFISEDLRKKSRIETAL